MIQVINAPPGVPIKLCRRCNQHKPLTDFYRSKANADGYDGRCKACDAIQCAERRRKKARVEVWSPIIRGTVPESSTCVSGPVFGDSCIVAALAPATRWVWCCGHSVK